VEEAWPCRVRAVGAGTVAPRALTRHVHTGQLARYPFDAAWKLAPAKQA
jgi:hypothetical protein